jgi:hypothetical protein
LFAHGALALASRDVLEASEQSDAAGSATQGNGAGKRRLSAIKPYYGTAAGTKLTALLKTHILQAVTVLKAAKAGNKPQLKAALDAWYGSAHQIAALLSHANPTAWPLHATTMMMNDHLDLTTKEAVDELKGRWSASVADYDKVEAEILMMSRTLAQGIIDQFPNRFAV